MQSLDASDAFKHIPFAKDRLPPIWVVGSGMTVPVHGIKGVPGTLALAEGLIADWIEIFGEAPAAKDQLAIARASLASARQNPEDVYVAYQAVMRLFYLDVSTEDKRVETLMHSIRRHVLEAYIGTRDRDVDQPDNLENAVWSDASSWSLRPGLDALAKYIKVHPRHRLHAVFTTNFDPLVSVAMVRNQVMHARTAFEHEDYAMSRVAADVPVVYHVHGHWTGEDTLNLSTDMKAEQRSTLAESIARAMRDRTIVVVGYGGWDDVLGEAIEQALLAPSTKVIWVVREGCRLPKICEHEEFNGDLSVVTVPDVDNFVVSLLNSAMIHANANASGVHDVGLLEKVTHLESALKTRNDHARTLAGISSEVSRIAAAFSESAAASSRAEQASKQAEEASKRAETKISDAVAVVEKSESSLKLVEGVADRHANTAQAFEMHRKWQITRLNYVTGLLVIIVLVTLADHLMKLDW